jgi:hypothetical protein
VRLVRSPEVTERRVDARWIVLVRRDGQERVLEVEERSGPAAAVVDRDLAREYVLGVRGAFSLLFSMCWPSRLRSLLTVRASPPSDVAPE